MELATAKPDSRSVSLTTNAFVARLCVGLASYSHPWGDMEDNNTRVASAATVIDLRSRKIIYSSARKAANTAQIIEAIDAAK